VVQTLQEAKALALLMADVLGRTVLHRERYARIWGLGDRKSPAAITPALVLMEDDPVLPLAYAAFTTSSTTSLPSTLHLVSRAAFVPPDFASNGPDYAVNLGHVLPPSLEDANAGEVQGTAALLPVSWQRMNHDESLTDASLAPEIVVLTDALQLASQPGKLPLALLTLKHRFPGALLWTPGLGGPDNVGVLASMGVDLFDLARCREAEANGVLLTAWGPRLPLDHEETSLEAQAYHFMKALDEVRSSVENGTLRGLVEKQSLSSPRLVEHVRRHHALMREQEGTLASHQPSSTSFPCYTSNALVDPLVEDWERFMTHDYQSPVKVRDVMILLPCSARKPYRLSKSHSQFFRAIASTGCHEVMMTSPLGLVPRDLEDVWPAANYDVPVTGDWSSDELARVRRMLVALVERTGYKRIINHTNMDLSFLKLEVVNTREGQGATHFDALGRLSLAVKSAVSDFELRNQKNSHRLKEQFMSIARKTTRTDAWLERLAVKGKLPRWRLDLDGTQMAVWSIDRNGFSFSRAAIDLLHQHQALPAVHLKEGVDWRGDVFAQMVLSFDASIRLGDDLRVLQSGEVVGLARAVAHGWEWGGTPGTLAKSHQRKKKR
jgi:archaeosine synthase